MILVYHKISMHLTIFSLYYLANLSLWTYWTSHSILGQYNLQALGVIVILYIVSKKFLRPVDHHKLSIYSYLVLFSAISLLILASGHLQSPFFFLFNFLLLAIALIFGYPQALVGSAITFLFFVYLSYPHFDNQTISNLFSIILITPFTYLISRYYLSALESRGLIRRLNQTMDHEHHDSLLFISQETKPTISHVIKTVNDLIIFLETSTSHLPTNFITKLTSIETDLMTIYKSASELEKDIINSQEDTSDNNSSLDNKV
jgi:hypothetical protein